MKTCGLFELAAAVKAEQTRLRLPSRPDWIQPTAEFLAHKAVLCGACEEARAGKLMLALLEALTNSVIHGNLEVPSTLKENDPETFSATLAARLEDEHIASRSVEILVEYDGSSCRWTLTDEGPGFDFATVLRRQSENGEEFLLASGRGILLMRTFLDEVIYEADGRRVVLVLHRTAGGDQRQQDRAPFTQPLQVVPVRPDGSADWAAATTALAQNVSADGMAFLQHQRGDASHVLIGSDVEGQPSYRPAEVCHWRALDGQIVEVGCRFTGPAAGSDAGRDRPPLPDRRAHPRVAYTEPITLLGAPASAAHVGFGRDFSRGGVGFIATTPIPLEKLLLALPQREGPPLLVPVRVLRCERIAEGFYHIGAQLLEPR